jgi:hypothetical protein
MKFAFHTVALAAAFATASAFAAGTSQPAAAAASAPAPVSAAKKALVKKLLELQQPAIENLGVEMAQQPAMNWMRQAGAALQNMPADKREAAAKTIQADVKKYADETVPVVKDKAVKIAPGVLGPILEQNFSEDELRTIVTWLQSPVSKKYAQMGGQLQEALSQALVKETQGTVGPRLEALHASLAKDLGLPPSPPPASAPAAPAAKK